jgi:hypothetical protein
VASTCDAALKPFRDEISQDEISQVGFHLLLMTVVKDREHDFARRVIARSWHPEWASMYETENMTAGDPVRRKLSRSVKPLLWSEARYDPWRATRNAAGRCACSVRRRASTASCAWPWRNTSRSRFDVPHRNPTPDRC